MKTTTQRRRALAAGILILALGAAGASTGLSGAWFTASATSQASVSGALLSIGEIGRESDQASIAVADLFPMTDEQGSTSARSEWITIRNIGTIPLDWDMQIVNPQATAPLTASQLLNFRFRLFDESGAALTDVLTLGSRPSTALPDGVLAHGSALAVGGQSKVEIRVWLAPESGNEYQGAQARFDVVINAIQNGAPAPALTPVDLTATRVGSPTGASTALSWNDPTPGLRSLGYTGTPTYTIERSTTQDFAQAVTVYTGTANATTDTSAGVPTTGAVNGPSATIDPSDDYLCSVGADGSVYCKSDRALIPPRDGGLQKIGGLLEGVKIVKISTGARPSSTTCAISDVGRLYCWGQSTGIGPRDSSTPALIDGGALAGKQIVDVVTSEVWERPGACAVASDGTAACWGHAAEHMFSRGTGSGTPVSINYGALAGKAVRQIQFTPYNACARTSDNMVACWGNNYNGLLGNGTATVTSYPPKAEYSTVAPVRVSLPSLGGASITDLSAAASSACVLLSNSRIYCWGAMWPWKQTPAITPYELATHGLGGISNIEVIRSGICAVAAGDPYCWGFNYLGTLGSNVAIDANPSDWYMEPGTWREAPTRVTGVLNGKKVTDMIGSDGGMRICAIGSDGQPACWGKFFSDSWDGVQAPVHLQKAVATTCPDDGTLLSSGSCGLSTRTPYYYRISYSVPGVDGWRSPIYTAARD